MLVESNIFFITVKKFFLKWNGIVPRIGGKEVIMEQSPEGRAIYKMKRTAAQLECYLHIQGWESEVWASQVLAVKNLPAEAGVAREVGSIPGSGRSPGDGNGHPFPYSCLGNPMHRRSLVGHSPQRCRVQHNWSDLAQAQSEVEGLSTGVRGGNNAFLKAGKKLEGNGQLEYWDRTAGGGGQEVFTDHQCFFHSWSKIQLSAYSLPLCKSWVKLIECVCVYTWVSVFLFPASAVWGSGATKLAQPLILQMRNWKPGEQTWFTSHRGRKEGSLAFSSSVLGLTNTDANE